MLAPGRSARRVVATHLCHYAPQRAKRDRQETDVKQSNDAIELKITPRIRSLGDFDVRRVLPAAERRMVGPFIFLDHMGPADFAAGRGMAVRPHPHIGLATITYLFEGEIMHRDSLGYRQAIQPGAVNLMTAGRGIVHSERSDDVAGTRRLHGLQSWIALPLEREEMEPTFVHYPAGSLPELAIDGCTIRVIMGTAYGAQSPVLTYSPTLYFEAALPAGAELLLFDDAVERGVYVVAGRIDIAETACSEGTLAVLREGAKVLVRATTAARLAVVGGAPVGARHIWWNFVSSSTERIEQAKRDWVAGTIGKVPGDDEFIPLPER
jgi:redox-sensitive bicupin YhaK (pirin superfamily)